MKKIFNEINIGDIKSILKRYLIIIIPIIVIFILFYNYIADVQIEQTKQLIIGEQKQRTKTINYILEDMARELEENLLVIKNSDELNMYINEKSEKNLLETEELFFRIAKSKKSFDKIRFIDEFGNEVIRVNNEKNDIEIVENNKLENVKNREYYKILNELNKDEIFISDMDLNIEKGEIEIPYKPIVRIATPVYKEDVRIGILVINYLGKDILKVLDEQFSDTKYSFIETSLINNEGYYIYNKDESKNFGFILKENKDCNLNIENPVLWKMILGKDEGYYEKKDEVNFYIKFKPLKDIEYLYKESHFWVVVSKFNIRDLPIVNHNIILGMKLLDFIILLGISLLILFIIIISYYRSKDIEQLNITTKIAENSDNAAVITDNETRIIYINKAFELATGYKKEEALGLKMNKFKSGIHSKDFYKNMWSSINEKGVWQGELWNKKKDGILYPKRLSIFAMKNKKGNRVEKYIGIFRDLINDDTTEKYNIRTELPNEKLVEKLINTKIQEKKEMFGIIYFTIKNYNSIVAEKTEKINKDIIIFIEKAKSLLKEKDFIAQISKNTFIIGVTEETNKKELECFVESFFVKNNDTIYIGEKEVYIDLKAGISVYPNDGNSANELITNASIALESIINNNEKKFLYYKPILKEKINKEMQMNLLLRKAINNDELRVKYQPQIRIKDEKLIAVEALLRWNNRYIGNVSPVKFIPLAEKTGYIIEIGEWLIERVFRDYKRIAKAHGNDCVVSINISPVQFRSENLIFKFKEFAKKYDVDLSKIEIEITESVFINNIEMINSKLNEFRKLGMSVAIDDFGTGFSSLSYLKNLNVDKLKIDRSFIKDYPEKDNGVIAKVVTNMAKELNLKVITEGVETQQQLDYIKLIGCNLVQGYYYSKPLELSKLIVYLAEKEV